MKASDLIKKIQKEIDTNGDLPIRLVINNFEDRDDPLNGAGSFCGHVHMPTGHVESGEEYIIGKEGVEDVCINTIEIEGQ